jgi:hypothetical protein
MGVILVQMAINESLMIWNAVDPVHPGNNNRTIASFTEAEYARDLRFKKIDLPILYRLLNFPPYIFIDNGSMVLGEYAFCLFLYRIHYTSTLAMIQTPFGRDYSQLSRILNEVVDIMDTAHRHKVMGNLAWYDLQFKMYNKAIRRKISTVRQNPFLGTVPNQINDIIGFIDGQSREVGRAHRNNNAQFPFWNGYYHMHCIIF